MMRECCSWNPPGALAGFGFLLSCCCWLVMGIAGGARVRHEDSSSTTQGQAHVHWHWPWRPPPSCAVCMQQGDSQCTSTRALENIERTPERFDLNVK